MKGRKLLLPDNKRVKQIYTYLLLKAIERRYPVVSYSEVEEAIAVAGVTPNKWQVKKYLLILSNNNPSLIEFRSAGLYEIFYELKIYMTDGKNIYKATINDIDTFKTELLLVLSEEMPENILTYAELLKQKLQVESAKHDVENV